MPRYRFRARIAAAARTAQSIEVQHHDVDQTKLGTRFSWHLMKTQCTVVISIQFAGFMIGS
jgi:hypothetical protein